MRKVIGLFTLSGYMTGGTNENSKLLITYDHNVLILVDGFTLEPLGIAKNSLGGGEGGIQEFCSSIHSESGVY